MKLKGKLRWPLWYYAMIVLTAVSAGAGAYFRGNKVLGDTQIDRMILGSILTTLIALATWAFRTILREMRSIGSGLTGLTKAVFRMETKLHPEKADLIMETFQDLVTPRKKNGEYWEP